MMKLSYSHAIVSYCPDLTSRDAMHLPVGVLLIGEVNEDDGMAAIHVPSIRSPRPDDITNEVLRAVPQLIQLHVDQALSQDPSRKPLTILKSLHEKLRNSLYVSKIHGPNTLEYGETTEQILQQVMSSTLPDLYKEALDDAGWQLAPTAKPPLVQNQGSSARQSVSLGNVPLASTLYGLSQMRSSKNAHA